MLRQVLIPSEQNATITLPQEWYGREVEVLAFPIERIKTQKRKLPHYIGIDMSGFKFSREEANAR